MAENVTFCPMVPEIQRIPQKTPENPRSSGFCPWHPVASRGATVPGFADGQTDPRRDHGRGEGTRETLERSLWREPKVSIKLDQLST